MSKAIWIFCALTFTAVLAEPIYAHAKTYTDRVCRKDYKRLCPNTPIGQCNLATRIKDLSPGCRAVVEKDK